MKNEQQKTDGTSDTSDTYVYDGVIYQYLSGPLPKLKSPAKMVVELLLDPKAPNDELEHWLKVLLLDVQARQEKKLL